MEKLVEVKATNPNTLGNESDGNTNPNMPLNPNKNQCNLDSQKDNDVQKDKLSSYYNIDADNHKSSSDNNNNK